MLFNPFFIFFIFYWIKKCFIKFCLFCGLFCFFRHLLFFLIFSFIFIVLKRKIEDRILHQLIDVLFNNFVCKDCNCFFKQTSFHFNFLFCPFVKLLFLHIYYKINMQNQSRLTLLAEHIKSQGEPSVLYEQKSQAIIVTFNRPKALNSLNLSMIRNIDKNLDLIKRHQVAWFQGSGGKSFCAGGDVKVLFEKDSTVEDRRCFFRQEFRLDYKISQLKDTIQISCWDGIVMGGGAGISAFAPIIIATEKTLFAMPEAKLGFFTDVGINYILSRMRNHLGRYLGMTGSRLKGEDVFISGLAHFYIPSSKISQAKNQIVKLFDSKTIIENPKQKILLILSKYHSPSGRNLLQNQDKIKDIFSLSSAQQIYLKAKNGQDDFSKAIAKLLEEQCPVSVALIYKLINLSKQSSLKQTFITDTIVVENMASNSDFREGVRCVLTDKGAIPKWSFDSILKVPAESVQAFLKPVEGSVPFE